MTKTKMGFSVEGEWLTEFCRELWTQRDGRRAIDTLVKSLPGMTEAQAIEICTGKKKLTGVNNVAFEDDNATKDSYGNPLLSVAEVFGWSKNKIEELTTRINDVGAATTAIASPWGQLDAPPSMLRRLKHEIEFSGPEAHAPADWDEIEKEYPVEVEAARARQEQQARQNLYEVPDHPALAAARAAIFDEPVKPKVDAKLESKNGWIDTKGKFWPCKYMGHGNLAYALDTSEKTCELSWVKVSDHLDPACTFPERSDFPRLPDRGVNQAQFNTMEKWCAKHGREMPEGLEVR